MKNLSLLTRKQVVELWDAPSLLGLLRDSHYLVSKNGQTIYRLRELPVTKYRIVNRFTHPKLNRNEKTN